MKWLGSFLFFFTSVLAEEWRDTYFIAIQKYREDVLEHLDSYSPFFAPSGKFYADPMLLKYQGINYLFFEEYDYKKGVISCSVLDPDLGPLEPKVVLELPSHLSFPFVFEEGKDVYMVPETYEDRAIQLFQSTDFPIKWKWVRTLVAGMRFSDPILFKYGEYYWLFASIRGDCLVIYYAKDLFSEFLPHPVNQKFIRGRNAGPCYRQGERWIRPTMDCREGYGKSVRLKEILLLTPKRFEEKEIAWIQPNWAPSLEGTHTYGQNEDYVVYDGKRRIFFSEDP